MGYDLDQFFRVKTEVRLPGEQKCYLRTLSDLEVRERQSRAVAESRKIRDELRDPESEAYKAFIEPLSAITDDELRQSIIALESVAIRRKVVEEIGPRYIPFPDDPSLEEQQNVQEEREKEEKRVLKEREKAVEGRIKRLEKDLAKRKRAYLISRMKATQENARIVNEFFIAFDRLTIFYSCFTDEQCQDRFFEAPEQIGELSPAILNYLLNEYGKVDQLGVRQLQDFFGMEASSAPSD